jgi:hypothetical protein
VWLVYLRKDFDLELIGSKLKNWTPSVQEAEPRGDFYVIKLYDLKISFFCSPCRSEREMVVGGLFGSFAMVGSQIQERNGASILSEFTCLVDGNFAALSCLVSCCGLNVGRSSFTFFALVG